jgi:hypothetical protein
LFLGLLFLPDHVGLSFHLPACDDSIVLFPLPWLKAGPVMPITKKAVTSIFDSRKKRFI